MDKIEIVKGLLTKLLSHFGEKPQTDIRQGEEGVLEITITGDDLNYLIGYRGQALDALADLLTHMLYKQTNEWTSIMLDINGYNMQRIERLHNLAKRFVDRVRFFQTEVEMPVLNAWERKQIHMYIKDYDDVETESRGEGRNRKLYLMPKK